MAAILSSLFHAKVRRRVNILSLRHHTYDSNLRWRSCGLTIEDMRQAAGLITHTIHLPKCLDIGGRSKRGRTPLHFICASFSLHYFIYGRGSSRHLVLTTYISVGLSTHAIPARSPVLLLVSALDCYILYVGKRLWNTRTSSCVRISPESLTYHILRLLNVRADQPAPGYLRQPVVSSRLRSTSHLPLFSCHFNGCGSARSGV